jgi:hypothetical protein
MADIGLAAFSTFFMGRPSFLGHQRALAEGHGRSNWATLFGMGAIPSDNDIRLMLDGALPALNRLDAWSCPARSAPGRPGIETASAAPLPRSLSRTCCWRSRSIPPLTSASWLGEPPSSRAAAPTASSSICRLSPPMLSSRTGLTCSNPRRRSDTATRGHNEDTPKCLLPAQFSLLARTLY